MEAVAKALARSIQTNRGRAETALALEVLRQIERDGWKDKHSLNVLHDQAGLWLSISGRDALWAVLTSGQA